MSLEFVFVSLVAVRRNWRTRVSALLLHSVCPLEYHTVSWDRLSELESCIWPEYVIFWKETLWKLIVRDDCTAVIKTSHVLIIYDVWVHVPLGEFQWSLTLYLGHNLRSLDYCIHFMRAETSAVVSLGPGKMSFSSFLQCLQAQLSPWNSRERHYPVSQTPASFSGAFPFVSHAEGISAALDSAVRQVPVAPFCHACGCAGWWQTKISQRKEKKSHLSAVNSRKSWQLPGEMSWNCFLKTE